MSQLFQSLLPVYLTFYPLNYIDHMVLSAYCTLHNIKTVCGTEISIPYIEHQLGLGLEFYRFQMCHSGKLTRIDHSIVNPATLPMHKMVDTDHPAG